MGSTEYIVNYTTYVTHVVYYIKRRPVISAPVRSLFGRNRTLTPIRRNRTSPLIPFLLASMRKEGIYVNIKLSHLSRSCH